MIKQAVFGCKTMKKTQINKIIGLTGQSGAGKSTVRGIFERNGFEVIDCDSVAREIARKRAFLDEISERFGDRLLNEDGSLNRLETASMIYGDSTKYSEYCGIIFPYITYDIMRKIELAAGDVLLDAPTLFEAGIDSLCSDIISVIADEKLCGERISKRDGISLKKARERLSSQHCADFFKEHSDYIIENSGSENELCEKALAIIGQLKGKQ